MTRRTALDVIICKCRRAEQPTDVVQPSSTSTVFSSRGRDAAPKRQLSFGRFPSNGSSGPPLVLGLPLPRLARSPDHCGFRGQGLKRRTSKTLFVPRFQHHLNTWPICGKINAKKDAVSMKAMAPAAGRAALESSSLQTRPINARHASMRLLSGPSRPRAKQRHHVSRLTAQSTAHPGTGD